MKQQILKHYYENGKLRYQSNWNLNEPETGMIEGWYDNGQKEFEIQFKLGQRISRKVWDKQGQDLGLLATA